MRYNKPNNNIMRLAPLREIAFLPCFCGVLGSFGLPLRGGYGIICICRRPALTDAAETQNAQNHVATFVHIAYLTIHVATCYHVATVSKTEYIKALIRADIEKEKNK